MPRLFPLAIACVAALVSAAGVHSAPSEPKKKDFVIQNDDGYGTSDCLTKGSSCGKIVADAWCESKGFSKSIAFRPADASDVTNSTGTNGRRARDVSDAFIISCTE